jgi:electron transfer flavoprotein alpha subunit
VAENNLVRVLIQAFYLADREKCGEYNPDVHKQLLLDVVAKVKPDIVIFSHSSYGWDLVPRVAFALKAAQISEVADVLVVAELKQFVLLLTEKILAL